MTAVFETLYVLGLFTILLLAGTHDWRARRGLTLDFGKPVDVVLAEARELVDEIVAARDPKTVTGTNHRPPTGPMTTRPGVVDIDVPRRRPAGTPGGAA